jgi:hypothetical protein
MTWQGTSAGVDVPPPAGLDRVRLETLEERRCVQTLHVGSFDDEAETLRFAAAAQSPGRVSAG